MYYQLWNLSKSGLAKAWDFAKNKAVSVAKWVSSDLPTLFEEAKSWLGDRADDIQNGLRAAGGFIDSVLNTGSDRVAIANTIPAQVRVYLLTSGGAPDTSQPPIIIPAAPAPGDGSTTSTVAIPKALWTAFVTSTTGSAFGLHIGQSTVGGVVYPEGDYAVPATAFLYPTFIAPNTACIVLQPLAGGLGCTYELTMAIPGEGNPDDFASLSVLMTLGIRTTRLAVVNVHPKVVPMLQGTDLMVRVSNSSGSVFQTVFSNGALKSGQQPSAWMCMPEAANSIEVRYLCRDLAMPGCGTTCSGCPIPDGTLVLDHCGGNVAVQCEIMPVPTPLAPTEAQCAALAALGETCFPAGKCAEAYATVVMYVKLAETPAVGTSLATNTAAAPVTIPSVSVSMVMAILGLVMLLVILGLVAAMVAIMVGKPAGRTGRGLT